MFTPDLKVEVSGEESTYDTSHIYTGEIYGEKSLSERKVLCTDLAPIDFENRFAKIECDPTL